MAKLDDNPVRLLVVDDVEDNRTLLSRRFAKQGYEIVEADSGPRALELVASERFDLVLLDIMMPGLDGFDVLRSIRLIHSPDHLPVIMVTARAETPEVVEALRLGANDYITKPVNFPIALARAQTQISRKHAQEAQARIHAKLELSLSQLVETNRKLENAIADRTKSEARAEYLVLHDALTGLDNRQGFQHRLAEALERNETSGGQLAIIFFDIHDFRLLNDTLGHKFGDALLAHVAASIRSFIPEIEAVARIGSDEFAVILMGVETAEFASGFAKRVADAIPAPHYISRQRTVVEVSTGIALSPGDGREPEHLISNANLALQRAKTEGWASCRFFLTEMNAAAHAQLSLKADMRHALESGEFEVFYQPLFELSTNTISGFEALLRWRHPRRGMISPAEFIPLAEETGLIVSLGKMVLQRACQDAVGWKNHEKVAVNISSVQFKGNGIISDVIAALAISRLPANRLEIEITESISLKNDTQTMDALHYLRDIGVGISLDDFGTGYSSLSYLRLFPFTKLKIDQSFVRDLTIDLGTTAIIRSLLDLAKSLGMITTAEGVETQTQMDWLRMHGCNEIQGYLISKPVAACDASRLLERQLVRSA